MEETRKLSEIIDVPADFGKVEEAPATPVEPTPPAEPANAAPAESNEAERPRGPDGKFIAKSGEPVAPTGELPQEPVPPTAPTPQASQPDPGFVPIAALLDTRDKLSARSRELDELRQKLADFERQKEQQPPVDPYVDFDGALNQRVGEAITPLQKQLSELKFRAVKAEAMATYGKEAVETVTKYFKENPLNRGDPEMVALDAQMEASPDPIGVAIEWHKRKTFDSAAHEAKIREDERQKVLAELKGPTGQPQPQAAPVVTPPSMASVAQGGVVPNAAEVNPGNKFDQMFNR